MEALLVRIALEQGFSLLCAVLVVTYVAPTTKGGAIVLGLVSFALATLVLQIVRFILKIAMRKDAPPPKAGSTGT
jgi:hypothetical protein